jgi:hypothetical protein
MIGLERFMRKPGGIHAPAINVDCNTASTKVDSQNFGNYNPNGLS